MDGKLLFALMRRSFLFFLLAVLGASTFVRAEAPNIIFITVDTTRATAWVSWAARRVLRRIWTPWPVRASC